nr:aminoglycoside phosphotransferase family protein [uncultured Devosia sp.]
MPASQFELGALKDIIIARFPDLAEARFTLLSEGWDSVAVDVDDRLIFKFPRHALGEQGLRREAGILGLVNAAVSLPVPSLTLFDEPQTFSRHEKIPGDHLLPERYRALNESARQALGETLGRFYAELHTIEPAQAIAVGAGPADAWLDADDILRRVRPVLPGPLLSLAETEMKRWRELEPDPYGQIYGFFDGHGWNMAFDHQAARLNGIYDFGDSGIGPLHREFVYSSIISPDLTPRIIASYERHSGRSIDRDRVAVLTSTHWLWELAVEAHLPENVAAMLPGVAAWLTR